MKASGEAFFLSCSAFAPALLVHGLTYLPGRPAIAALLAAGAVALGALTGVYLRVAHRRGVEQLVGEETRFRPGTADASR